MPVLLDTTRMTPAQRATAMEEFVSGESLPMRFDCSRPLEQMSSWGAAWYLGNLQFLQARGAAMRGVRTKREIDTTPVPKITVAYSVRGVTTGTRGDAPYVFRPGELMLLDLTEPYDMAWEDGFSAFALQITHDELGVTPDVAYRAVRNPQASPVYDLVRRHIGRTCTALPSLQDNPAGQLLGGVTMDLIRTLLLSAGAADPETAEVLQETLPVRIERWILDHLGEPSLNAEGIAAAHFLSVRQLYYVWAARNGETLAEWIMSQRLERAARALAAPAGHRTAIGAVARRCGFTDPAHFTRRFRERYGVTPRDWRALHRPAGAPGAAPRGRQ
jgi:AraC-like DNA-binding protein